MTAKEMTAKQAHKNGFGKELTQIPLDLIMPVIAYFKQSGSIPIYIYAKKHNGEKLPLPKINLLLTGMEVCYGNPNKKLFDHFTLRITGFFQATIVTSLGSCDVTLTFDNDEITPYLLSCLLQRREFDLMGKKSKLKPTSKAKAEDNYYGVRKTRDFYKKQNVSEDFDEGVFARFVQQHADAEGKIIGQFKDPNCAAFKIFPCRVSTDSWSTRFHCYCTTRTNGKVEVQSIQLSELFARDAIATLLNVAKYEISHNKSIPMKVVVSSKLSSQNVAKDQTVVKRDIKSIEKSNEVLKMQFQKISQAHKHFAPASTAAHDCSKKQKIQKEDEDEDEDDEESFDNDSSGSVDDDSEDQEDDYTNDSANHSSSNESKDINYSNDVKNNKLELPSDFFTMKLSTDDEKEHDILTRQVIHNNPDDSYYDEGLFNSKIFDKSTHLGGSMDEIFPVTFPQNLGIGKNELVDEGEIEKDDVEFVNAMINGV